jgi:hypothetical protein
MGVVSGTSVSNGYLILESRENGDLLLKAEIPLRNMPVFNKKGIDPFNFYLHRNIIVTGKMNYERIPTVYVDNPSQITFVDNAY